MMQRFSGHRVLCDGVFRPATLTVEGGQIVAIDDTVASGPGVVEAGEHALIPGLIELHTDNHEKYFEPRPGVHWPAMQALLAHDAHMASAGITTVFDAIAIGYGFGGVSASRERIAAESIQTLLNVREEGIFRVDHRVHLRCEVSCQGTDQYFAPWAGVPGIDLVSLMDHAPGQRQFVSIEKYREYNQKKYGYTDHEFELLMAEHTEASARFAGPNRLHITALCHTHGIALASHDDATVAHVEESLALGCTLAEFPTTMAAGEASHRRGLKVMMGAPNVIRGGSHSGNVAAKDFAMAGWLDVLSSDYYPSALLQAAVKLTEPDIGVPLERALSMVTSEPAQAAGLNDRGVLAEGRRADFVMYADDHHAVRVLQTYAAGQRVF